MPFGPWKVLRIRDYAIVWTVSALSDLGTWMQIGALGIFVTQSTGQARWTGIASTITYLSAGIFAPLGGVLADRLDRKKLVMASFALQALTGMLLAYCFAHGVRSPFPLIALAGLQGALTAAVVPALNAMIPDLVPADRLANAAFLDQISWNLGRAFGPIIAVAVIHAQSYTAVFVLNALSFAAVAACMPLIRAKQTRHIEDGSLAQRLATGWNGLRHNRICLLATLVAMVEMVFVSPFIAFIPAMGQLTLHGTASTSGALFVAQGIGSALGALLCGSIMHRFGQGHTLVTLSWIQPFLLIAYALSPNVGIAILFIALLGGIHTAVFSLCTSVVQQYAAQNVRGRVVAFNRSLLVVSYAIVSSLLGVLATHIGLRQTFLVMSAITLGSLVALMTGTINRLAVLSAFDRSNRPTTQVG